MMIFNQLFKVALREAEQALGLNSNDIDAPKVKSRVLIYAGQYEEGQKLANHVIRLDPAVISEPLYLVGLANIAMGNCEKSVNNIKRAIENDPVTAGLRMIACVIAGPVLRVISRYALRYFVIQVVAKTTTTW
ncbi:MAG: tetratricopeptide (TPR) repeat protein [Parasphingorhabdus sp.]|jgi:tetratricopeptide (TPR) repeat protein